MACSPKRRQSALGRGSRCGSSKRGGGVDASMRRRNMYRRRLSIPVLKLPGLELSVHLHSTAAATRKDVFRLRSGRCRPWTRKCKFE